MLFVCKDFGDARTANEVVNVMDQDAIRTVANGVRVPFLRPDSLVYETLVSAHLNSAAVRGPYRHTPAARRARERALALGHADGHKFDRSE